MPQQLQPVFRRRLAENFLEHAVEMRQRLEADLERDFAHAQIWIQQEVFGFFNPHPREIVREIDAGNFFERLAKIERAHVDRPRDLAQRQFLALMFQNVFLGALDDRRFGVFLLDEHLVAQHGQVLRPNREQLERGLLLPGVDDFC